MADSVSSAKSPAKNELTLEQIENNQPKSPTPPGVVKQQFRPDVFSKFLVLEGPTHWLFRLGFASIFLVNAVYATLEPQSFIDMLNNNPVASLIGHADFMVKIAMVNDLLLGIFIIGGWRKRLVYAWAGLWLLLVAGLKLMNYFV